MKRHVRQRGIALIIVLGLMSVLIIMAVAFSVSMRTERLAARSFTDETRSREMVRVALARASLKVQDDLTANKLVAPNWAEGCLYSTGGSNVCRDLLAGTAAYHIPRGLWTAPFLAAASNNVRWVELKDPLNATNLVGRYAWIAVDCSGLLDGNRGLDVSPWYLPRGEGTNAAELCLSNVLLGEVSATYANNLARGRREAAVRNPPWRRAETLPDLGACGYTEYTVAAPAPFLTTRLTNFVSFSYFPTGYCDSAFNAKAATCIPNLAAVTPNKAAIATALSAMPNGPTGADADMTVNNLVDYLDEDLTPSDGCKGFCTEPVPMIDEIAISSKIVSAAGKPTLTVTFEVKLWFPFGTVVALTDNMTVTVNAQIAPGASAYPTFAGGKASISVVGPWQRGTVNEYKVAKIEFKSSAPSNTTAPASITIGEITVTDEKTTTVIDRVMPCNNSGTSISWSDYFSAAANVQQYTDWQVNDPRINYDWDLKNTTAAFTATDPSTRAWHVAGPAKSLTRPPQLTAPFENLGILKEGGRTDMYVRNKDPLPTVGELGFLLYRKDRPWQTISLVGSNALPVLDRFTVQTNANSGVVNINTSVTNVLASAFLGLPKERWPGQPTATPMSSVEALTMARLIMSKGLGIGFYTNLSDLAYIDRGATPTLSSQFPDSGAGEGATMDAMTRESMIRTTSMLLGVRQNLFTVILAGQAVSDDGVEVVGEQRAVAMVWRDPYKDAAGKNRTFIRFLKWLDD